jgi:NAD(P)-dependent dehydrogenase (short-subunit alcohol dehydrogenase family)
MNHKRFEGKFAVVTGGSGGIGLAAAKAYAREGARVAITGRDEKALEAARKEIGPGTLAIRADAAKLEDIEKATADIKAEFGRIDALFVNAGVGRFVPLEQVTEEFFDEIMDVNLKGLFFTVQKALPLLPRGSAVVLNASINAHIGMQGTTVYGATKAAVVNLARTLSADLAGRGVRVNAISPGPIETNILSRTGMSEEAMKQARDWLSGQVPLHRFGRPEEIAAAVLFLTSEESSFVVGSELIADGGMGYLKMMPGQGEARESVTTARRRPASRAARRRASPPSRTSRGKPRRSASGV